MTNAFELDYAILTKAIELHGVAVAQIKAGNPTGQWNYVSMIQPISPIFTQHSLERGGNVVGLDQYLDKDLVSESSISATSQCSHSANLLSVPCFPILG
jgi:hypothetical protein